MELQGLIMWLVGEGMMLFFLYILIRNMVLKRIFIFKNIDYTKTKIDEKKVIRILTLLSWACLSLITFSVSLIISAVMILFKS